MYFCFCFLIKYPFIHRVKRKNHNQIMIRYIIRYMRYVASYFHALDSVISVSNVCLWCSHLLLFYISNYESGGIEGMNSFFSSLASGIKVRRSSQRRRWTEEEKEEVRRGFSGFILEKKLPGKHQIEKVQKMEGVLAA